VRVKFWQVVYAFREPTKEADR